MFVTERHVVSIAQVCHGDDNNIIEASLEVDEMARESLES